VVIEDHQWRSLCEVLELEHLFQEPTLVSYEARLQHAEPLGEILGAVFQTRPLDHWLERLSTAGVPSARVVEREALAGDPQATANDMFLEQDHPAVGPVKLVALPFHLSRTRDAPRLRRPAPALGEHTDRILTEMGYGSDALSRLHEREIVLQATPRR
jgi:formyl-CoA transferase